MVVVHNESPDCEFHSESDTGSLAQLAVDDSGWGDDLVVDTSTVIDTTAARADLPGQRTIDVRAEFDNTDTGYIYNFGNNNLRLDSGGDIVCAVNSSDVITLTCPSVSGSSETFLISWATEANPLTTGASDAYRSDLWIYNEDQLEWNHATATHAIEASTAQDMVWLGSSPGNNIFSGDAYELRLCSAYHSSTELSETFLAQSSAPTLAGIERLEFPVPPVSTYLGHDGMPVGPIEAMSAVAVSRNDLLMAGPIVNEVCTGDWAEDSTWTISDPQGSGYDFHLEFLRRRPISPSIARGRVRVFVQQNAASAETLGIRVYSASAPGPNSQPGASPDDYVPYYVVTTRNADDGTGASGGAWVTVGDVRISRDNDGYSYFWVALLPGSVTDYRIKAWTIEPVRLLAGDVAGGGGGFGGVGGFA